MIDNVLLSNHLFIRKYNVTHFQNHFKSSQQRKNMEMKTYSVTFQEILEIIENHNNRKFGTFSKIFERLEKFIKWRWRKFLN